MHPQGSANQRPMYDAFLARPNKHLFWYQSCDQHSWNQPVGRIDNVYGDRNLFCSCVPMSAYED